MKKLRIPLLLLILLLAYLLFYPVSIDPVSWKAPEAPSLVNGTFAQNTRLQGIQTLLTNQCIKPEDVAIDSANHLYTGLEDGSILRLNLETNEVKEMVNTGGRPLGLRLDAAENLIIADADKGLLRMNKKGEIELLTDSYNGEKFVFTDDLDLDTAGVIYFTDASRKFPIWSYKLDLLEHRPNGRLYAYYPSTKNTTLLLDSLYFANGVAVSKDQTFLLCSETSAYRVIKYWLKGPRKGEKEVIIDNLPGFPDGVSTGTNGIFWISCPTPRQSTLDALMTKPFVRKVIARLPEFLQPAPEYYSMVIGIDGEGNVRYNLQNPKGDYAQITNVVQVEDKLYFGSLFESSVGVISLKEVQRE